MGLTPAPCRGEAGIMAAHKSKAVSATWYIRNFLCNELSLKEADRHTMDRSRHWLNAMFPASHQKHEEGLQRILLKNTAAWPYSLIAAGNWDQSGYRMGTKRGRLMHQVYMKWLFPGPFTPYPMWREYSTSDVELAQCSIEVSKPHENVLYLHVCEGGKRGDPCTWLHGIASNYGMNSERLRPGLRKITEWITVNCGMKYGRNTGRIANNYGWQWQRHTRYCESLEPGQAGVNAPRVSSHAT